MSRTEQSVDLPLLIQKKDKLADDVSLLLKDIKDLQALTELLSQNWNGAAAQTYLSRALAEISRLNDLYATAKKLLQDYTLAVSVYRSEEQRLEEIFLTV